MSAILDTIIARGFNLNQPEFGNSFVEAKNKRQVIDNGLQNDEMYRQAQQFDLNTARQTQADQQAVGSALAQYQSAPQEVLTAADQALANFDASAARGGVNPALRDKAVEIVNNRGMKAISDKQLKAAQLVLQRSPGAQEAVATQMFAQPELEAQDPLSELGKLAHDMDRLDPNDPRRVYFEQKMKQVNASGDGSLPASLQEWQAYNSMTPEDRGRYLEMKRNVTPFGVYMQGPDGAAAVQGFERDSAFAGAEADVNGKARASLGNAIPVKIDAINALERTLAIVEEGAKTGRLNQHLVANDAELQALQAVFNDSMLSKLAEAKANGATPGAMSEGEWKIFGDAIANIRNKKEANVEIIKYYISKAKGDLARSQEAYAKWEMGGGNPRANPGYQDPVVTDAPTTGDADSDPIVERYLK